MLGIGQAYRLKLCQMSAMPYCNAWGEMFEYLFHELRLTKMTYALIFWVSVAVQKIYQKREQSIPIFCGRLPKRYAKVLDTLLSACVCVCCVCMSAANLTQNSSTYLFKFEATSTGANDNEEKQGNLFRTSSSVIYEYFHFINWLLFVKNPHPIFSRT